MWVWRKLEEASQRHLPGRVHRALFVHNYLVFFLTGVSGVLINLVTTWFFTEFVFGLEGYFQGYLLGVACNLLFNFTVHTFLTFKAKTHIVQRMVGFVAYSLSMTTFQAWVVKTITPMFGLQWYLATISLTIFVFSFVTFVVFKLFLFKDMEGDERRALPRLLVIAMFTATIIHMTGLFEVLNRTGLPALVSGDSTTYLQLAERMWSGDGFSLSDATGRVLPEVNRTPGLPVLLAPFTAMPDGIVVYLIIQTILASTLLPFLVFNVGKRSFSYRAGMIAAWLVALEPQMMFSSWTPLTEIPYLIFTLFSVDLFLILSDRTRHGVEYWSGVVLAGLLSGWAVYLRPGNFMLFVIFFGGIAIYASIQRKRQRWALAGAILLVMLASLFPWEMRSHSLTGVFGLSGGGWKNVYVDFLGSVEVIEDGGEFTAIRIARKESARQALGLDTRAEISSPEYSAYFRRLALPELWEHKWSVVKLESLLMVSFFTNDNYYNQFIRHGFISNIPDRISPSQVLLRQGIAGIPRIMEEMRKQYFIPILSRLYQFFILALAVIGLMRSPRPVGVLLGSIILAHALVSTVGGLAMEIRYRMPIMPILFLFAAHAFTTGFPDLRSWAVVKRPLTMVFPAKNG